MIIINMETLDNNYEIMQKNKAPLTTKEIQSILLNLLKEFDAFCNNNNLKYCLAWGSELGAVRHKGFIPWDDDLDVCMPRKDYDRFLKMYKNNNSFKLYIPHKTKRYYYPFAKLCDEKTFIVSDMFREPFGVFLDIFPFDKVRSNNRLTEKKMYKTLLTGIIPLKKKPHLYIKPRYEYLLERKSLILLRQFKSVVYFAHRLLVWKMSFHISLIALKLMILINYGDDCYCQIIWGEKPILRPKNYFITRIKTTFEDTFTYICMDYDNDLHKCYGNYMKIPDEEERLTHTPYTFFSKNNED